MENAPTDDLDRSDMTRLAAGQDAALDDLMGRHGERLFHYLLRVLQNEAEAADLAQEAFVRVYLQRARFRPREKFSTWLYTIATNLARDVHRRRARHPQVSLDAAPDGSGRSFRETLPAPKPAPDQLLESRERVETVRRAVAALPEELRVPLVLAEYEEQSHAEIGAVLNCSPKAVEMRIYRARQELRRSLKGVLE
jgi:RNA polymerase sigma-70 factor (ECF subfamily)